MNYSYYPGCTLRTKAKDLDFYAKKSLEALGSSLVEVPDWQCCGGVYSTAKDEVANKLSAVRALVAARDAGQDLVTVCSACHNVLKQVNNDMKNDEYIKSHAGSWQYEDGMIHLFLVPENDNGVFVNDSYPVLTMNEELWIGRSENGLVLPHFPLDLDRDVLIKSVG